MTSRITSLFINKQATFIFVLFLFFFPLKTQFFNTLTYVYDQVFMGGIVTEIYTYNFLGELIGCKEISKLRTYEEDGHFFQVIGAYWLRLVVSGLFWLILFLKTRKSNIFKTQYWVYVVIFCFYIAKELEYFVVSLPYFQSEFLLSFIPFFIFCGLGIYTFFKIFGKKERLQVLFIAFPASVLSLFLWYAYLGPKLLPISTS
ncbi:hypothetical protein C8N46_106191 [Kordia periserrulae]|uniref:Uncharacterized protein n=1 Tax=Kordia periserrulae TaxID=701523 RepID=A0A2T6BWT7_9FLAO|nr:hypothetical protein [Kordia periserrulae]PTX60545.1 hypothetical protein C8N46_106191 [Kordia periserrulae]